MTIALRGLCPLLEVFDMPRSLRFYRDVLGFSVVERSGEGDDVGWVWLRHGDAALMLNTAHDDGQRPPSADPARVAAHGDTALFLACEDVDGAYAHLSARDVRCEPPSIAPYGMEAALRDRSRRLPALLPVAGEDCERDSFRKRRGAAARGRPSRRGFVRRAVLRWPSR